MDSSKYKQLATTTGQNYSYYSSAAQAHKPTVLFIHGFPSTSYDWRHQVTYFQARGYGVIVPDQLGYGGTSKPTDTESYRATKMTKSIVGILDAEGVEKVVAIGHDWGSYLVSRLASYYPERFLAFGFLSVGYQSPEVLDLPALLEYTKKTLGYELFGYWYFFSEEGADAIIESHIDSFLSILYPRDPESWKTDFAPMGALKSCLLADKQAPMPDYITEQDKTFIRDELLKGGFKAPLNWYKSFVHGVAVEDDKGVPKENWAIAQPVFFGAALKDYVCLADLPKASMEKYCHDLTIKEYDSDHWVQLSCHEVLNGDLESWINKTVVR